MGTSVRNLKGKNSTIAKMCCLVQRAIFIDNPTSPILLDTVPYIVQFYFIHVTCYFYIIGMNIIDFSTICVSCSSNGSQLLHLCKTAPTVAFVL